MSRTLNYIHILYIFGEIDRQLRDDLIACIKNEIKDKDVDLFNQKTTK